MSRTPRPVPRFRVAPAACLIALGALSTLSACGQETPAPVTATVTVTTSAAPVTTATTEPTEPVRASTSEEVPGPSAVEPVPARTVKPYLGGIAVFTTPSGNISCGIYPDAPDEIGGSLRCGISSYSSSSPYGLAPSGGYLDSVSVREGVATMFSGSDVPPWMPGAHGPEDTLVPQVLGYGETLSHADFLCSSEREGLTCWDTVSGAGAFMSREKVELF